MLKNLQQSKHKQKEGATQRTSKQGFRTNTGIWVQGKGSNLGHIIDKDGRRPDP